MVHRFYFQDELIIDDDVHSIRGIEPDFFVGERQDLLTGVGDFGLRELVTEAFVIGGFEQTGAEGSVDFDREADDLLGECGMDEHGRECGAGVVEGGLMGAGMEGGGGEGGRRGGRTRRRFTTEARRHGGGTEERFGFGRGCWMDGLWRWAGPRRGAGSGDLSAEGEGWRGKAISFEMLARGESVTDWARVDAMSQDEVERVADEEEEPLPEGGRRRYHGAAAAEAGRAYPAGCGCGGLVQVAGAGALGADECGAAGVTEARRERGS